MGLEGLEQVGRHVGTQDGDQRILVPVGVPEPEDSRIVTEIVLVGLAVAASAAPVDIAVQLRVHEREIQVCVEEFLVLRVCVADTEDTQLLVPRIVRGLTDLVEGPAFRLGPEIQLGAFQARRGYSDLYNQRLAVIGKGEENPGIPALKPGSLHRTAAVEQY